MSMYRGFVPLAVLRAQVKRGSSWRQLFILRYKATGVELDLQGYKGRAAVRPNKADTSTPVLSITTENGRMTVAPTIDGVLRTGAILIEVSSTDTVLLSPNNEQVKLGFDIDLYDDTVAPYFVLTPVEVELTVLAEYVTA